MIVFQVSLIFDPVKEILRIRCQIYFLIKWLFWGKYICDSKVFRSITFQPFQYEPEQKKACDNESDEEETKHIYDSAADLLFIIL